MDRLSSVKGAEVWKGDRLAGYLERTTKGSVFLYADEYLANEPIPVASTLPIDSREHVTSGHSLPTYFANLLPEGLRLQALLSMVKASQDDHLSILVAAGNDAIGDATVRLPGDVTTAQPPVDLNDITFQALFAERFGVDIRQRERVSIPGVQEKVSASRITGPVRHRSGESIIKLNFDDVNRPKLLENENFFLKMANACGIEVAKASLITDRAGDVGLLVHRFDRISRGRSVTKLHMEDACQFLDAYPHEKYDLSVQQVVEGLQRLCTSPIVETIRLLEQIAFSYLILNGDLHAKNISLIADGTGTVRLSPAYDLISTWPYQDHRMALKMDGAEDKYKIGTFVRFAERYGVNEKAVRFAIGKVCDSCEPWIERVGEIGLPDRLAGPMQTTQRKRLSKLRESF